MLKLMMLLLLLLLPHIVVAQAIHNVVVDDIALAVNVVSNVNVTVVIVGVCCCYWNQL